MLEMFRGWRIALCGWDIRCGGGRKLGWRSGWEPGSLKATNDSLLRRVGSQDVSRGGAHQLQVPESPLWGIGGGGKERERTAWQCNRWGMRQDKE